MKLLLTAVLLAALAVGALLVDEADARTLESSPPNPSHRPGHCTDYLPMEFGHGHPANQRWFDSLDARGYARVRIACLYRWGGREFHCLDRLWWLESRWNHQAANPRSSAYGIAQMLKPAVRYVAFAPDVFTRPGQWRTDARLQVRGGIEYVAGRYGSPCRALDHFYSRSFY